MKDDLISRQAAIDEIETDAELLKRVLDNTDIVGSERKKYAWGLGLLESLIEDIKGIPSAESDIIRCKDCKYYCNVLYSGTQFEYGKCCRTFTEDVKPDDFCSRAERGANE